MMFRSGYRPRRKCEGAALLALVLTGISCVLYVADTWSNLNAQKCILQFPLKWFGCAMAAHETLAGGLIAGGGALLAAWWAAAAVWQQIEDTRDQVRLAEKRREELEAYSFARVFDYYSRLLRSFDDASGLEDQKYINGLNALYKTGNLVPFFGSLPADQQSLTRDAWERLSNLNHALGEFQKAAHGVTEDIKSRNAINAGIRDVVSSIREFRERAAREVANRPIV